MLPNSGIRCGVDVLIALALGAAAVLLGRPGLRVGTGRLARCGPRAARSHSVISISPGAGRLRRRRRSRPAAWSETVDPAS
ncbi:MAG: alpha-hydroxy-acid oxidizing protein [Pseudonocardiaceae bacterium]